MYRHIMVPLDGSPEAEQAIPAAVAIAVAHRAALHFVHVRQFFPLEGADGIRRDPEADYLHRIVADTAVLAPEVSVAPALLTDRIAGVQMPEPPRRAVAEVLHGYAKSRKVDLIILTTHGRSGLRRFWLGSVADALIRTATMPTLVVRPRSARRPLHKHVLIALDGSEAAEEIIPHATGIGGPSARYTLLRVVPAALMPVLNGVGTVPYLDAEGLEYRIGEATRYLEDQCLQLRSAGLDADSAVLVGDSPPAVIGEYGASHKATLIALTTRGLGGARRFLLGSTADKVVRTSRMPVLILNALGREEHDHRTRGTVK